MVDGYIINCWPDANAASSALPITAPPWTRMWPRSTATTLLKPVTSRVTSRRLDQSGRRHHHDVRGTNDKNENKGRPVAARNGVRRWEPAVLRALARQWHHERGSTGRRDR